MHIRNIPFHREGHTDEDRTLLHRYNKTYYSTVVRTRETEITTGSSSSCRTVSAYPKNVPEPKFRSATSSASSVIRTFLMITGDTPARCVSRTMKTLSSIVTASPNQAEALSPPERIHCVSVVVIVRCPFRVPRFGIVQAIEYRPDWMGVFI